MGLIHFFQREVGLFIFCYHYEGAVYMGGCHGVGKFRILGGARFFSRTQYVMHAMTGGFSLFYYLFFNVCVQ